jgi:hypothetical protein
MPLPCRLLKIILDAFFVPGLYSSPSRPTEGRYRDADWRGATGGACGRGEDVAPRTREASGSRPGPLR